jgi:hypothetical protein
MEGCTSSRLHKISHFALDILTLNFSYAETSADSHMWRYLVVLCSYIMYCVSEHHCLVLRHASMIQLVSVDIIMGSKLSKLCESVTPGTNRHLMFWNRRQDTEYCVRILLFILSASSHRFGSRTGKATTFTCTPLQTTKIESSHYSTSYNVLSS